MTNPLIKLSTLIPFRSITAEQVEPGINELLKRANDSLLAIENCEDAPSYDNTLAALEEGTEALNIAMTVVGHLESVVATPELREAYNKIQPEVSAFYAAIPLREKLWQKLLRFSERSEAKTLTGEKARYLSKTLNDFRRHGAELGPEDKERLRELSRSLSLVTTRFSQNVVDATAAWEKFIEDPSELKGMPESSILAAAQDAKQRGKSGYRLSLQAPSVIPVLSYCENRALREEVYRAFNSRCSHGETSNQELLREILQLRKQQATILGYADFADLVLADRMAHNGATAAQFVSELQTKCIDAFKIESAELNDFAKAEGGLNTLHPWDIGFWSEKLRQKLYNFDDEQLRPYFPLNRALEGLFATATKLFGITIRANAALETWHDDVQAFDIFDGDQKLASFYADFFPRDEKRGGAWMNAFITGLPYQGGEPHVGLICCNFTPPLGASPALLNHNELTTLFHEFGHLIHHCLTRVQVKSLAGTNVAWDFVELPSQILENWCWQKEVLDGFARHYESDAVIPSELFEKMLRARTFRAATFMMRQLSFSHVDLFLHRDFDVNGEESVRERALIEMSSFAPTPFPEDYAMICSFTHLFSSSVAYAAGYYSYKWAEVLDADAFTRFEKEGVFNADTGRSFRQEILERGDSEDPAVLFQNFMGREPAPEALLRRSGLIQA